jgi:FixJ family two-component response regulator
VSFSGPGRERLRIDPPTIVAHAHANLPRIAPPSDPATRFVGTIRGFVMLNALADTLAARAPDLGTKPSAMLHPKPTMFIVDDHIAIREALEALVRDAGWQPKIFASAAEFLAQRRVSGPSCLVLDVYLPEQNGLALQQRLAAERTAMPIIFIAGHGDVPMSVQAMKAGAVEFLMKLFRTDVLLDAICQAIRCSETALDDEAEMHVLRERHASISRREREVMALVVAGLMNKQAAADLGISEITVKAHRGRVMKKNAGSLVCQPRQDGCKTRPRGVVVETSR